MTDIDTLRSMCILVVENNLPQIIQLRSIIEEGGFTNIVTAKSSEEAMSTLRGHLRNETCKIDLVLIPTQLKDSNIHEFCHSLKNYSEWEDIPVIVTADSDGWWQEATARQAYEAGASDVVFKPIRAMDLIPRITLALTLKKERDQRRQHEEDMGNELAERKIMEARLQYLVGHDDLTGLSNRRRLEQAMELAVLRARNFKRTAALLYLDLDQFKVVNDTEGHDCGDRMLVSVANILRQNIKPGDLLARIGSDEFALLIENTNEEQALIKAEELRKTLDEFRFESNIRTYHLCTCVGVTIIEGENTATASEYLAQADQACHIAKNHGRNIVHKYNHDDTELHRLRNDVHWVPMIRDALMNDRFFLLFQPVVRVADGKATHYEALIRMKGENGEVLSPEDFIPAAERMGLIHHIDLWVVENAIDFLSSLSGEHSNISLNINLSGHAFQDQSLISLIQQKLDMTWISANRLTFEITETAAIANYAQTREMVARLRALGCRFALDDFGAGFNSFNYLKNFPVDYLKLDGAFISNLRNDPVDKILVKSMIAVAHSLGKKTVAEYVEDGETMALLKKYGIDYVQGFYLGKPAKELTINAFTTQPPVSESAPTSEKFRSTPEVTTRATDPEKVK
ncbi:MAG: EAL domain-containing protein [Gammaproteobacteria bacterium]|nr:EAL domain-containing protein [Gammaproteobacteria bacterium]MDH5592893.1 EAL domain-containing protein [Gammaproteobacteria bacterium]